jgi:hypothetical protein
MRTLTIFCFLVIFTLTATATGQSGDILIWNSKKYSLFSNPLESYPQFDQMRGKLFGDKPGEISTGCVRGYIAEWQIFNDTLYLTNIYGCYSPATKADLKEIFPKIFHNGKIKADWVNQILLVPDGKCIFYGNLGYSAIFEKESELTIQNGRLVDIKVYDNSKSHTSIFTQKPDSLMKFIDQNIQWNIIPDTIKDPIRVVLRIVSTDTNKPEITIVKGSGLKIYDDEAVRVANQIPEWDVYIQRGKVFKMYWSLPIIFSKEKKLKYTR